MIRCLIVDNDNIGLNILEDCIRKVPDFRCIKGCNSALEAMDWLYGNEADVIYLNVDLPGINGLQLLESLRDRPEVVVVADHERYALRGYEFDVADYLVKPFTFERFVQACNRVLEKLPIKNTSEQVSDSFFINVEYSQVKVFFKDICYVRAMRDYACLQMINGSKLLTLMSMKTLEEELSKNGLIRTHKSYIANVHHIQEIRGNYILVNETAVPVSDKYRSDLMLKLGIADQFISYNPSKTLKIDA